VIAHRGASDALPEHTPAAYRQAIADGADALECDVRLTADRQLVCVHDATVRRTSSGRGSVSSMTLDQLRELDWGAWKLGTPRDGALRDAHDLMTARELFELVRDQGARGGRQVGLAVETKHPQRFGGAVEERLAELLADFGWDGGNGPSPVRVMSFSAMAMRRMHRLAPHLELVYLMERVPRVYRDGSLPQGATIAGLDVALLRAFPEYVERAHRAGRAVHVWTVDEPDDVSRCLAAGVAAIITNRPRAVLAQVRRELDTDD
jgi:glycerophosphoryl diester phosphodiesterase